MPGENDITRRTVVGGAVAGLGALTASASAARQAGQPRAAAARAALRDPRSKHPGPPFASQTQPWPGLASRMNPRPDHGETSYCGSGRLAGRKALITGGDSGNGRAAAIAFAREGADVAIGYLPYEEPDAREVVALIRAEGRNAVTLPGDIRNERFCGRMVAEANERLGGLDILVNNAARLQTRGEGALSTAEFDWTMKTNIYAPYWITQAAIPLMRPGSAIIMTASALAYNPTPDLWDYSLTKAANVNFAKSMAKRLAARGIRVNAVAPGIIWTPIQVTGGSTQEELVNMGTETPLGRPGQPIELAGIFVSLAEADSSLVTGQVFGAAGGTGLQP